MMRIRFSSNLGKHELAKNWVWGMGEGRVCDLNVSFIRFGVLHFMMKGFYRKS